MRNVETETAKIAFQFSDARYLVRRSQLSSYEKQHSPPSLFKFYSLMTVYRCSPRRLLASFGIPGRAGGRAPLSITPSAMRPNVPQAKVFGARCRVSNIEQRHDAHAGSIVPGRAGKASHHRHKTRMGLTGHEPPVSLLQ